MKIFILCGGYGSRLDHESKQIAKPMVRVGKEPILFHLMKSFINHGFLDFVLCLGYKKETIINYFLNEKKKYIKNYKKEKNLININFLYKKKNLKISLVDTGLNAGTGGRIKIAYNKLRLDEDILMTYGDGLCSLDMNKLLRFHYKQSALVTLAAVRPKQRYGVLKIKNSKVDYFDNSKKQSDIYINGGYHVISKQAISTIKNKKTYWEKEPLIKIQNKKKLFAFEFDGFWKSLDTQKDKVEFNELYKNKKLKWLKN